MPEPEVRAVAKNLLEAMRFFGNARPAGEVLDLPGLSVIYSGLDYAAFNAALLAEPVGGDGNLLRHRVEVPAGHFRTRKIRWTWWVCDHFLEAPLRREAGNVFARFGLRPLTSAPGMYADRLRAPVRKLPALDVRTVGDQPARDAFAHITSAAFEIPFPVCHAVYASERAWNGSFRGYIGYSAGEPVASAAVVVAADAVGLYSVATLPGWRNRGYGEVIVRAVLDLVKAKTGIETTVLQSTSSGYSLYSRMGYRKVTNFNVYIAE
jgi:GNAT superfamily N-acetyltransferase